MLFPGVPRPLRLAALLLCPALWAQLPYDPLTPEETAQAESVLLADAAVKQRLANETKFRILYIVRHEFDKSEEAPPRRADVLGYLYTTDDTLSAVVRLGPDPLVEALSVFKSPKPAFNRDEVTEATRLALADPGVRAGLKAAGIAQEAQSKLRVLSWPVEEASKNDPCARHRCVALAFHTATGPVNLRPIVDLSAQRVSLSKEKLP